MGQLSTEPLSSVPARTLARLLRAQRALCSPAADGFLDAIGQALDELGRDLGLPL